MEEQFKVMIENSSKKQEAQIKRLEENMTKMMQAIIDMKDQIKTQENLSRTQEEPPVIVLDQGLLNEENEWCTNEKDISVIVQRFYENLFTSSLPAVEKIDELLTAVQPLVTEEMWRLLERDFNIEEIKKAMFSIAADKSPGPDGMNAMFYQQHWDIVGPLVSEAILDCLNEKADLDLINSTLVTLIPKVKEPRSVGDFRPISLCNVLYKVISKVLINRLKPILPLIINGTQSAFVPDRLITDNALIAYECLHHLRLIKGGKRSYVTMKLDMSKAYDRVEWTFIEKMLIKMGFSQLWVNKIMRCVTSVRYSFQINGMVYGEVIPSRGLRQGDPLSPYLFLICAEGFSALLRQAEERRDIMGMKIASIAPSISHLFFADDSLLFLKASTRSLQSIQNTFSIYSECSGQVWGNQYQQRVNHDADVENSQQCSTLLRQCSSNYQGSCINYAFLFPRSFKATPLS